MLRVKVRVVLLAMLMAACFVGTRLTSSLVMFVFTFIHLHLICIRWHIRRLGNIMVGRWICNRKVIDLIPSRDAVIWFPKKQSK